MKIDSYSFGCFVIDNKIYRHDIKIINNEIRLWKDHGLNMGDVSDILENKPEIVIIGTGEVGVVNVSEEIKNFIEKKAKLIIAETGEACRLYNELSKKQKVNAVLHSTC